MGDGYNRTNFATLTEATHVCENKKTGILERRKG